MPLALPGWRGGRSALVCRRQVRRRGATAEVRRRAGPLTGAPTSAALRLRTCGRCAGRGTPLAWRRTGALLPRQGSRPGAPLRAAAGPGAATAAPGAGDSADPARGRRSPPSAPSGPRPARACDQPAAPAREPPRPTTASPRVHLPLACATSSCRCAPPAPAPVALAPLPRPPESPPPTPSPCHPAAAPVSRVSRVPSRVHGGGGSALLEIEGVLQLRGRAQGERAVLQPLACAGSLGTQAQSPLCGARRHLRCSPVHLIVHFTLAVPRMILAETALSFLNVGLRPPVVSWGVAAGKRRRTVGMNGGC